MTWAHVRRVEGAAEERDDGPPARASALSREANGAVAARRARSSDRNRAARRRANARSSGRQAGRARAVAPPRLPRRSRADPQSRSNAGIPLTNS